jgi:hypothetical protein
MSIRKCRSFMTVAFALVLFQTIRVSLADDSIVQRVMLVPSDLGEVRFGDPIYVPIAIVNRSNGPKSSPLMSAGSPALLCSFSTADQSWNGRCFFSQFRGPFHRHELPARSSESTVMCIDVWHPKISKSLLETRNVSIEFEELDKDGNPVKGLSARTKLTIVGSAFRDDSDLLENGERFLEVYKQKSVASHRDPNSIETRAMPLLYLGMGNRYRIDEFGVFSWFHFNPASPSYENPATREEAVHPLTENVRKSGPLFRLVRAEELIKQFEDAKKELILPLIDEYRDNLRSASQPEFHYLVRLLFHHDRIDTETRDILTREFPHVVGAANPDTGKQHTSSMSILSPE